MESTVNLDILELDEIYKSALDLYHQQYFDASAIYGRKFVEKFLTTLLNYENISIAGVINLSSIAAQLKKRIGNLQYNNHSFSDLHYSIDYLIKIGNKAAHNPIRDKEISNEYLNRIEILNDWFREYINDKKLKTVFLSNIKPNFPNFIVDFHIKNYQCIYNLRINSLPSDAQFIVFTGENGYGKTSILQAIAIGLCGNIDEQSNELLLNGENSAVSISLYQNNDFENRVITNTDLKISKTISNVVAYGASRLQLEAPESMFEYNKKRSPIYSLFHTEGVLQNIEYWLLNKANKKQQTQVKDLLVKIMPHIDNIKINGKSITYFENGHSVDAGKLSAGHKSVLAMIGDMLIRLYEQQPSAPSPSDLTGIVLIDEIEAHLHPKWQREFPKLLANIFPKIQFIVTTHSVITFLGMPKNSVFFNVSRSENGGTEVKRIDIDIANFLPHQILTSPIFGMENVLSVENTDFGKIRTENTYDEVVEHDKIRTELKNLSQNFKFPQHLKAL